MAPVNIPRTNDGSDIVGLGWSPVGTVLLYDNRWALIPTGGAERRWTCLSPAFADEVPQVLRLTP